MQRAETLYHDTDTQPAGRIALYLSDVANITGLPREYCRSSADELDAGIVRFVFSRLVFFITATDLIASKPLIIVTYDQLRDAFLKARKIHQREACLEDYAQETYSEEMARRMAEEKEKMAEEMARRMAEEKEKMAKEMAQRIDEEKEKMAKEKEKMAEEKEKMAEEIV